MADEGHLGITALSRITLASAGLSCFKTADGPIMSNKETCTIVVSSSVYGAMALGAEKICK